MKWFKFYGQDFLTDPKMRALTLEQRMCWIILMCLANAEDKNGSISFITEEDVMKDAGIEFDTPSWYQTLGFLKYFETLSMITIDNANDNANDNAKRFNITLQNFDKRQETNLSGYERVKKFRENHKQNEAKSNDNNDNVINDNARIDKIRIDKNRIEEKRVYNSSKYLLTIPDADLDEFTKKFVCTKSQVKQKAENLHDYCLSRGRVYKNYKAFLRGALSRDFGVRTASSNGLDVIKQKQSEYEAELRAMGGKS